MYFIHLCVFINFILFLALKTIKTEELDVNTAPQKDGESNKRDHAIPGQITRDTADARVAGGRQVIRMVTTKQKSNPYNVIGSRNSKLNTAESNVEPKELTMGQKLAMKHYLLDPKQKEDSRVCPKIKLSKACTHPLYMYKYMK